MLIEVLTSLAGGLNSAQAMRNVAAQNQAYANSQMAAASQLNAYRQGQASPALSDNYYSTTRPAVDGPVYEAGTFAAMVEPTEHERKLIQAEEHLEAIKASGAVRRQSIRDRIFAPGSPYVRGVATDG